MLVTRAREIARVEGFHYLVKKLLVTALWAVLGRVLVNPMIRDFRAHAERATTMDSAVELALGYRFLGAFITPQQIREEITRLLREVKSLEPRTILEIGTAKGGTLFLFTRVAVRDALLVSVDLPGKMYGSAYPEWMSRLLSSFATEGQKIILVRGDSHSEKVLSQVKDALQDRTVDFLFIDGDHYYEGVRRDFETYAPLVRKGGVVVFHDICEGAPELVGGVPRFWSELKSRYRTRSIISDPSQQVCGIGVVQF